MYTISEVKQDNNLIGYEVIYQPTGYTVTSGVLCAKDAQILAECLNESGMLKEDLKNNKRGTILAEANDLIYGDRAAAYGPVSVSFERIARFWEIILGVPVTAEQVGHCMIALKMSRQISKSGRDNLVDIAGYAGCIAKMEEEKTAD
jgi:hypothetical protein